MTKILDPNLKILELNKTIGDYWAWAYSDILSNRNRSIFAEFLVGNALGIITKPRVEWDYVDFCYRGKKIEVKSSAYLQSWDQKSFLLSVLTKEKISKSITYSELKACIDSKLGSIKN